jgi:hypothetical protein
MSTAARSTRRNIDVTKAHAGDHERCLAVREVLELVGDKFCG